MSYTDTFTGGAVAQSSPSFFALTMASTTALVWPLESTAGVPYAASWINVTATATSLQLQMPPGNTGSTGPVSIISNVGSNTFTVTDQAGNQITPIAAGQVWIVVLTNNATANGTWTATQLGSTVSNATASGLAGPGLTANGSLLQLSWATTTLSSNAAITSAADGSVLLYTGAGAAAWSLGAIGTTVTDGTIFAFLNQSSGLSNLTFSSAGGNLINGVATLVIAANSGGFLIAGTSSWTAITYGSIFPSLSVANGTMTVDTSGNLVANSLTGVTTLSVAAGALTISNTGRLQTASDVTATGLGTFGNITTAGTVNATGLGTFGNITTAGTVNATGNISTGAALNATGLGTFGNITTAGTVNATGNISTGAALNATGLGTFGNITTAGTVNATGAGTFGNIRTTGTVYATGTGQFGNVITSGTLQVNGQGTLGNINTAGTLTVTNGVVGNTSGGGANSGIVGEVITGNFVNITLSGSGVINSLVNINLTAGDWDVKGVASFAISGVVGYINIAVSTNGSFPGYNNGLSQFYMPNPTSAGVVGTLIPCQVVLAAGQAVSFLYQAIYSSGTIVAQGFFQARRMR